MVDRLIKSRFFNSRSRNVQYLVAGAFILTLLFIVSRWNFLLFHLIVEIFSVVIAVGIYIIAWNTRRVQKNKFLLILGYGYLTVALFDLIHMLTYQGMKVIPATDFNTSLQLWISARFLESLALIIAFFFFTGKKRRKTRYVALFFFLLAAVLMGLIFGGLFPVTYRPDVGLTGFKKGAEYAISLLLLGVVIRLLIRPRMLEGSVWLILFFAILTTIWSELSFSVYRDPYGYASTLGHLLKVVSFYLIYRALIVTGLRKPYDLLYYSVRVNENRFRQMINQAGVSVFIHDFQGNLSDVNRQAVASLGYSHSELMTMNLTDLQAGLEADELRSILASIKPGVPLNLEINLRRRNGGTFPVEIRSSVIRTMEGREILSLARDISERKMMEAELYFKSITDELTGLYNRRGFFTLVAQQLKIADRRKQPLFLLYIDMDNMKHINDRLGHGTGDQALVEFAGLLKESFRQSDIVARMGGDEFAVLVVNPQIESEERILERMLDSLDRHNGQPGRTFHLHMSSGLVRYDQANPCSIEELLAQADQRMYSEKKRKGGSRKLWLVPRVQRSGSGSAF